MEAQAIRMVAPSAANGGWSGDRGLCTVVVGAEDAAEEYKPSLSLRLGIGSTDHEFERKKPAELTRTQMNELYHQFLVYNYLAARLPVPPHLLLPLQKSDATSSYPIPFDAPLLKHHSTSIRFRQEALDYMNSMIPDMERCRRTDGKKWRCNKNVVPHHKYCERHVNRGQQRCRRPLEISRIASPSQRRTMSRMNDDIRQAKVDISLGLGLNTDISSDVNSRNKSSLGDKDGYGASAAIAPSGSSSAGNQDRGYVGYRPLLPKNGLDRNNDVIRMNVFPRLEHWPSFILQGQANRPWPKSKGVEFIPDPWRCRRTDGKKWQCSRTALPDQKYCERHIHRGSKRPSEATRPFGGSVINVGPPTTSFMAQNSSGSKRPSEAPRPFGGSVINIGPPTTSLMAQNSSPANLNTSFSISTPAASQRVEKLDVTTSCSESDTIISDTTIDA